MSCFTGWWFVHVETTNEEGWVPSSCLELHEENMGVGLLNNMSNSKKQGNQPNIFKFKTYIDTLNIAPIFLW